MVLGKDGAAGVLTPQSWRPLLVGCLVLASKVWEDWCICNNEAAHFAEFTTETMFRLEFLVLDTLEWNANISAEVFAPYFWAVERVITEGVDDIGAPFDGYLPTTSRKQIVEIMTPEDLRILRQASL
jgi:hypothetical protein